MASPKVTVSELDFSTRVPSFPGVYGAICINAKKGPLNEFSLVTSETQLLQRYGVDETVNVGDDLAHFSALAFLEGSNKLWVNRVGTAEGASRSRPHYAAVAIARSSATAAVGTGYDIGDYDDIQDYDFANHSHTDGTKHVVGTTTPLADQPVFLIAAKSPGTWGSNLKLVITDNSIEPSESNAFNLVVYYKDIQVESFVASRKHVKDGYGRSLYIEDVLSSSEYITAVDNTTVAETFEPLINPTANDTITKSDFSAGANGTTPTDADRIREMKKLENTNQYNLTLLLDGGNATAAYQKELIRLAEARQDCVAILSVPIKKEKHSSYINRITSYRDGSSGVDIVADDGVDLNANTSYAGLYTPHLLIYDKFNDRQLYVAPDGYIGAIISRTADSREIWYPPAGFNRGIIGTVLDVRRRFTEGELDILYDKQINPIRYAPGRGIVCWGQKTQQSRPSSLDRINVRLLLIVIEPAIKEALEYFIFEFNDVATRLTITSIIQSYMDNIRSRNGVYDFQVTCSEENNSPNDIDNNRLNVWLFVKPTKSVEFIRFNLIITPTGVDFSNVIV